MRLILILSAVMLLGCVDSDTDRIEHDRAVFKRSVNEIRLVSKAVNDEPCADIGRIITNMCIDGDISHETHRRFENGTKEQK